MISTSYRFKAARVRQAARAADSVGRSTAAGRASRAAARRGSHVRGMVDIVMMVNMVVEYDMTVTHRRGHAASRLLGHRGVAHRRTGRGFLSERVTSKTDRSGGGDKTALDHRTPPHIEERPCWARVS